MKWRKAFVVAAFLLFGMTFFRGETGTYRGDALVLVFAAAATVLGALGAGIYAIVTRGRSPIIQLSVAHGRVDRECERVIGTSGPLGTETQRNPSRRDT
jgi:hypothetical protein